MDTVLSGVISGVVANCITELTKYLGSKEKIIENKQLDIQAIIREVTKLSAEKMEWAPPPRLEEVCLYLVSPELESIIRQIVSINILGNENSKNMDLIEKEFSISFALFVNEKEEKIQYKSKILFKFLLNEIEHYLNDKVDKGILSAHEAKSSIRYHILKDEIEGINKNISFLIAQKNFNVKTIIEFENKYRQQVGDRHRYIVPPHFDIARKIPIDDLYVIPHFTKKNKKTEQEPVRITGTDFLSVAYRSVILGDPGSGKSSFALKLCHQLSLSQNKLSFCRKQITPVLVILRDYGAEKS